MATTTPDLIGRLINAGIDVAQELQDCIDEGLDAADLDTPEAGSSLARMQAFVDKWETAYVDYTNDTLDTGGDRHE